MELRRQQTARRLDGGAPLRRPSPDPSVLWALARPRRASSCFGTGRRLSSAACVKSEPRRRATETSPRFRSVGSSWLRRPSAGGGFKWIYWARRSGRLGFSPAGGGTEPVLRVRGPRVRCLQVGARAPGPSPGARRVEPWMREGEPREDEVGGLVDRRADAVRCLFFWNSPGRRALPALSYFEHVSGRLASRASLDSQSRGGAVVYGRSNSTIARQGVRRGDRHECRAWRPVPEEVLDGAGARRTQLLGRPRVVESRFFVVPARRDAAPRRRGLHAARSPHRVPRALTRPRHVPDEGATRSPRCPSPARRATGSRSEGPPDGYRARNQAARAAELRSANPESLELLHRARRTAGRPELR